MDSAISRRCYPSLWLFLSPDRPWDAPECTQQIITKTGNLTSRTTGRVADTEREFFNLHSNTSSNNTAPTEQVQDNTILELGESSSGAAIRLLLKSIRHGEGGGSAFTYQLGNATIEAIANCADRSWISYPEHRMNRPQSPATEQIMIRVCEGSDRNSLPGVVIVHDHPSNVRVTPNCPFLCTIDAKRTIRVGQPRADWYPTAAWGRAGFIHSSQLQF